MSSRVRYRAPNKGAHANCDFYHVRVNYADRCDGNFSKSSAAGDGCIINVRLTLRTVRPHLAAAAAAVAATATSALADIFIVAFPFLFSRETNKVRARGALNYV